MTHLWVEVLDLCLLRGWLFLPYSGCAFAIRKTDRYTYTQTGKPKAPCLAVNQSFYLYVQWPTCDKLDIYRPHLWKHRAGSGWLITNSYLTAGAFESLYLFEAPVSSVFHSGVSVVLYKEGLSHSSLRSQGTERLEGFRSPPWMLYFF